MLSLHAKKMSSESTLVWVVDGKTLHPAHLLMNQDDGKAVIEWVTTGAQQIVDSSRIQGELPPRRKRTAVIKSATSKPDSEQSKRVKVEHSSSPDSRASVAVAVTPDPLATTEEVQDESDNAAHPVAMAAPVKVKETSDEDVNGEMKDSITQESVMNEEEAIEETEVESEGAKITRVKKEEVDRFYSNEAPPNMSSERKARREKMMKGLTGPETQEPRAVFRRGCHPQCIATVLGGQGTHPYPTVKNVPNGDENPFIQEGHRYIAGNCDWNPWAPRFPGDNGLVDACFYSDEQPECHMFTSCSNLQSNPLYHGKDAKGKWLYLGKYSVPEEGSDDDIVQGLQFKDLEVRLQHFRVKWFIKKDYTECWTDAKGVEHSAGKDDITQDHFILGFEDFQKNAAFKAETKWEKMSPVGREVADANDLEQFKQMAVEESVEAKWEKEALMYAWTQMLIDRNLTIDLVPVKFEGYDEALYRELVSIGANNGQVTLGACIV